MWSLFHDSWGSWVSCDCVFQQDIWDNRIAKLRTFMLTFIETGASYAKVDNLTSLEMSTVRPFFPHSLEQLHRIKKVRKNITNSPLNIILILIQIIISIF